MSKVIGIYDKFTKTTRQIWLCHVTLASNSENFYFFPNSILNFRKSYQIWAKLAQEQKVTGEKQIRGWKRAPQCYAYRVELYHADVSTPDHTVLKLRQTTNLTTN